MKKLLFTAVSALALAGVATAADSTEFAVMTVSSTAKRTLVAVPWVAPSTSGANVTVSNLFLTANLSEGDTLDVLNTKGASMCQWKIAVGEGGVKYWEAPEKVVVENEDPKAGEAADTVAIPRGSAVVLIRQNPTNDVGAIPFYIMGQVASTDTSTTIIKGTKDSPCYNLIAPPSTVPQTLNSSDHCATWSTAKISSDDRIYLSLPNGWMPELKYTDSAWSIYTSYKDDRGRTKMKWIAYNDPIPLGTGFWYVSKGGDPSVTWMDVPKDVSNK